MSLKKQYRYHNTLSGYPRDPLATSCFIPPVILLMLGLVMGFFAMHTYREAKTLAAIGVVSTARVTDMRVSEQRDSKNRLKKTYESTISFSDAVGNLHTYTENKSRKIGDTFEVLYDPNNPTSVQDRSSLWTLPYTLIIISLLAITGGIFFLINTIIKRSRAAAVISSGHKVSAVIIEIKRRLVTKTRKVKKGILVGHQSYERERYEYQVVAEETTTNAGGGRTFLSCALFRDPGEHLVGKRIEIPVDRRDPNNYYFSADCFSHLL